MVYNFLLAPVAKGGFFRRHNFLLQGNIIQIIYSSPAAKYKYRCAEEWDIRE